MGRREAWWEAQGGGRHGGRHMEEESVVGRKTKCFL
jgi:hypothetical protein